MNLLASCPTNLQTAIGTPWEDFDSGPFTLAGSFNYTFSTPGTYCVGMLLQHRIYSRNERSLSLCPCTGGRNLETTRMEITVDTDPYFGETEN